MVRKKASALQASATILAIAGLVTLWASAPSVSEVQAQEVARAAEPSDDPEAVLNRQPAVPVDVVILGGLNKITARVSTIRIPLNQSVEFGTLSITARTCAKRPPTEPPETTAFLEITDDTMADGEGDFTGWMFASSPAISALEHPVYDVWVLDCKIAEGGASAGN